MSAPEVADKLQERALRLLQEDASKIENLIEVQMANLTTRQCPLYEEVLDTQMYGFSREVDFATRAGLIAEHSGKEIISRLERNLAVLYEALDRKGSL
ncbi:DUF1507 family protein [Paenibacillus sp. strain BS8-2]